MSGAGVFGPSLLCTLIIDSELLFTPALGPLLILTWS
jgi:hypothetical protein